MTLVPLDLTKTLEENANAFFEQAKKYKKKREGALHAIALTKEKLAHRDEETATKVPKPRVVRREPLWYEKFRWFFSSDGYLCIGGRDATTNEVLIKKHTDPRDWVFHTDMAGSPFVVVKVAEHGGAREDVPQTTMDEAAQFCASCSRAWKSGLAIVEVFYVAPDQVSKEPNPGEYLTKGAFVIRGKTTYKRPRLGLAACTLSDGRIMVAPRASCERHAAGDVLIELLQGNEKPSEAASLLRKLLPQGDALTADEIIRALPAGGVKLGKKTVLRGQS